MVLRHCVLTPASDPPLPASSSFNDDAMEIDPVVVGAVVVQFEEGDDDEDGVYRRGSSASQPIPDDSQGPLPTAAAQCCR